MRGGYEGEERKGQNRKEDAGGKGRQRQRAGERPEVGDVSEKTRVRRGEERRRGEEGK